MNPSSAVSTERERPESRPRFGELKAPLLTVLRRGVEPERGHGRQRGRRAVLDEVAPLRRVLLAEEPHRLLRHMRRTPEVHLERCARRVVRHALRFTRHRVPGVAEHDVDAPERRFRLSEGSFDVVGLGDVEAEDEELLRGVLRCEVCEDFGLAEGRDDAFAVREGDTRHLEAEARGGTGDCRLVSRCPHCRIWRTVTY